jgi:hypothetical protein
VPTGTDPATQPLDVSFDPAARPGAMNDVERPGETAGEVDVAIRQSRQRLNSQRNNHRRAFKASETTNIDVIGM